MLNAVFNKIKERKIKNKKQPNFTVIVPLSVSKGKHEIIQLIVYSDEQKVTNGKIQKEVLNPTREIRVYCSNCGMLLPAYSKVCPCCGMTVSSGRKSIVPKEPTISAEILSDDIKIKNAWQSVQWNSQCVKLYFDFIVPLIFTGENLLFSMKVYVENILISKLKFTIDLQKYSISPQLYRTDIKSAFVSYAKEDRNQVLDIIQGVHKVCPNIDIFIDFDGLKSGQDWEDELYKEIEARDIFYLCWSRYAKQSKYVEKEWRYALKTKGIDAIEPIPLEDPALCEPPEELKSKHFNDREIELKK